ncbi:Dimeric dUTPase [hydrothermal vent metagenome]|uniref:Dimeric dUTPase n=1 Tax=hydrothermal vent metagenome TaxID=652676 RepID=A0A3B0WDE8_9ZZZZ
MKQKLINMLELQNSMNSKVNENWRSAGNEWYRAIWMEASEMLEHYGWKWWKKQAPDVMQVKLEVVDIVHFALSIRLEQNMPLADTAELIAKDFENSMQAEDIRKSIECLALLTLTDQGAHFTFIAGIMKHLEMSFDELYEIYVGKNVLNMFRQDNGYKEGTYNKVWNGREDNEYLADIMAQLNGNSETFQDDVYTALSQNYAA